MTEGKSIPPSQTLTRRLRSLLNKLDNASVASAAKQVCGWVNSFKDRDERFQGLLRSTAELVLERATERPDRDLHHVLARFCKTLDTATDGAHAKSLSHLWEEEVQAISIELRVNNSAEAGSWPECVALVSFAGELSSNALLQPDVLRSCAKSLSGLKSNLGLSVTCTLLEAAGQALCRDLEGKDCFDDAIRTMLSGEIPAQTRSRVLVLAAQRNSEGTLDDNSNDAQWDEETVHSDDGEEHIPNLAASQLCKPKHDKFYFESGDIIFVCEETSFRVQSDILTNNSKVFSDVLQKAHADGDHLSNGRPCIHLMDTAGDFATLLKVFYTSGFPHRHKTPDFTTFSSLLRMATKYEFKEIRSQILEDLVPAYPTTFSKYEISLCLGEKVFGAPSPHPNSVLNLLVQCKVAFALPFAYYRVCVAGDPASLDSSDEEVALPPDTLRTALRGQQQLKKGEVEFAKKLSFKECTAWKCVGKSRAPLHEWIVPNVMVTNGILERGSFSGSGYCKTCMEAFPVDLLKAKEETWKELPSYFNLLPWGDATYTA